MIFETGTVVSKNQDSLMVETIQQTTCDSCSAQKGCGHTALAKLTGTKNEIRVLPGDFCIGREVVRMADFVLDEFEKELKGEALLDEVMLEHLPTMA